MSSICIHFLLRARPVSTVAGGVDAFAQCELDHSYSSTPHHETAMSRRHFDGIAVQN